MAIIIEKDQRGNPTVIKSLTFPPTEDELRRAEELDTLLERHIPEIEKELIAAGLMAAEIPAEDAHGKGGNIALWYELGRCLQSVVENERLVKPAERKWLWTAIRMYASQRILRKDRGNSRLHLDYCYRVSVLPWDCVRKFHWDDWVYLLDSKSFRQESRADQWIQSRVQRLALLTRQQLRHLVQQLNGAFTNKDTAIFGQRELFTKYDAALSAEESSKVSKLGREAS
jgi:hypothetical protein